jgi:precorrin-6B methylase 2
MQFHPKDPFSLGPLGKLNPTYQEILSHSTAVDAWLGFEIEKIEAQLAQAGCRLRANEASGEKQQLWLGLAPTSLQTPYTEIRDLIERLQLKSGSVLCDLGAAYGRMGFVVGQIYPQHSFIGYEYVGEYVGERVNEFRRCASRFQFSNVKMVHADLSSSQFRPEPADVYFIYDYGSPKAIRKTLYDLQRQAKTKKFSVVIRGLAVHEEVLNSHAWLVRSTNSPQNSKSSIFHSQIEAQPLLSAV